MDPWNSDKEVGACYLLDVVNACQGLTFHASFRGKERIG